VTSSAPSGFSGAVLRFVDAPLSIEPLSLSSLDSDDVLVRVRAAGICHTDLEAMTGAFATPYPVVLGHEGAGIVEAIGSAVSRVKPGDHVVFSIYPLCGTCFFCRRDQSMLCEEVAPSHRAGTMPGDRLKLSAADGSKIHHFLNVSSFAEYAIVTQTGAIPIDAAVPFEAACLLGCSVITGIGAAQRVAGVRMGDSVVVVGCGPVGLNVIQGARLAGAEAIIAIDRRPDKLPHALALGATHTTLADDDAPFRVRRLTGGRGADHAFEAAGLHDALQTALDCSRAGGTVTILGKTDPSAFLKLRAGSIMGERRIVRSSLGGARASDDFPIYARLYLDGRLKLDELIDLRLPLSKINDAFGPVSRGELIRAVVSMPT
jgi:S-(hydroxymethyl)glutathione dehydrogenase / alcohol dehydrogenase